MGGVTGGVTKWGYIFEKVGLQNSCQAPPPLGDSNNPENGGLLQETDTLRTTFESPFLA